MTSLSSPDISETDGSPSIVNIETKDLYQTLQRAMQLLGDDAADPRLLDLIVIGEVRKLHQYTASLLQILRQQMQLAAMDIYFKGTCCDHCVCKEWDLAWAWLSCKGHGIVATVHVSCL